MASNEAAHSERTRGVEKRQQRVRRIAGRAASTAVRSEFIRIDTDHEFHGSKIAASCLTLATTHRVKIATSVQAPEDRGEMI
jgi:hypothetical protein